MSFENWNRFVDETKQRLQQDREQKRNGCPAAGSEKGGAKNDRKGEGREAGI